MEQVGKKTNIYALKVIEMKKKKRTYYIGKSLAKHSIHRKNGSGGSIKHITQVTTHLFSLNRG